MDELYEKRMRDLLGDEFDAYVDSMQVELYQGLRISPRKQPVESTREQMPFLGRPSPFAANTWYVGGKLGLHPAHVQGLFYLQEPSASSAVSVLGVQPSDTVLDLCAAPGSKSTQIADAIEDGFLLSNEIDPKRAQILVSNMERMGVENFMVTNMDSPTLCRQVEGMFDRVLVDAPCSGEGMMKKHEAALAGWSYDNVLLCAARQKDILKEAWKALKPGGTMVYSTCTYAPEENEANIAWLLEQFDDAILDPIDVPWGRSGFAIGGLDENQARAVRRIFPMDGGEGHFIARLKKSENASCAKARASWSDGVKIPAQAQAFLEEQLDEDDSRNIGYRFYETSERKEGTLVSGMNHPFLVLKKGKVLRQGVQVGTLVKKRFEPAYAFYLSRTAARCSKTRTGTTLEQMNAYFHGEQLGISAPSGYRALCYKDIPYGFGKSSSGRITNKLPKGLRLLMHSKIREIEVDGHESE